MARVTGQGCGKAGGPWAPGGSQAENWSQEVAGGGGQGCTRTEPAQCVLHCPPRPHLGNAVKGKITKNFKMVTADY